MDQPTDAKAGMPNEGNEMKSKKKEGSGKRSKREKSESGTKIICGMRTKRKPLTPSLVPPTKQLSTRDLKFPFTL